MDIVDMLRNLVRTESTLLMNVMSDVTDEQAAWVPPGTANTIGATYAHVIRWQDNYLATISGQQNIWESGRWAEKLGMEGTTRMNREADEVPKSLAAYREYAEAVFEATDSYLGALKAADLDREVQGYRGPIAVGELIPRSMLAHISRHLGEIAALKGVQGMKGLPF